MTEFKDYYGRELGYVLSKDYWGKGLMPEAVNAVKDYLFGELDYDFLICGYYDFNEQSKRVQTKCGFKPYFSMPTVPITLLFFFKQIANTLSSLIKEFIIL